MSSTTPIPLLDILNLQAGAKLKDISFSLYRQEIYGLIGVGGSGKSALLRVLLGHQHPQAGLLHWREGKHSRIGGLLEPPSLYKQLDTATHLDMFADYYECTSGTAQQWLDIAHLRTYARTPVADCPWEVQQRLGLALVMLADPRLVLLDNPFNGLPPNAQATLTQLIEDLRSEQGVSFLIASQQLEPLEPLATRLGLLHQGKISWEGTWGDLPNNAVFTLRTYALPLAQRLISELRLRAEAINTTQLRVQLKRQADIGQVAKQLVFHGIELLGIVPQRPMLTPATAPQPMVSPLSLRQ